ncbi:hypothetical protein B0H13DRAFT_1881497 [Mycena leptocephala]|nr:hypothetical protein B0H13DRAFT_1881497 [Mycena leptocephala]
MSCFFSSGGVVSPLELRCEGRQSREDLAAQATYFISSLASDTMPPPCVRSKVDPRCAESMQVRDGNDEDIRPTSTSTQDERDPSLRSPSFPTQPRPASSKTPCSMLLYSLDQDRASSPFSSDCALLTTRAPNPDLRLAGDNATGSVCGERWTRTTRTGGWDDVRGKGDWQLPHKLGPHLPAPTRCFAVFGAGNRRNSRAEVTVDVDPGNLNFWAVLHDNGPRSIGERQRWKAEEGGEEGEERALRRDSPRSAGLVARACHAMRWRCESECVLGDDGDTCTQEAAGVGMSAEGTGFPDRFAIHNATHANERVPVNASTLGGYPGCCGAGFLHMHCDAQCRRRGNSTLPPCSTCMPPLDFSPPFRMVRVATSIGPPLAQVDACSGNGHMGGLRREVHGYSPKCLPHVTVFFALDNNAWSNRRWFDPAWRPIN